MRRDADETRRRARLIFMFEHGAILPTRCRVSYEFRGDPLFETKLRVRLKRYIRKHGVAVRSDEPTDTLWQIARLAERAKAAARGA